jgi:hypothetical protein
LQHARRKHFLPRGIQASEALAVETSKKRKYKDEGRRNTVAGFVEFLIKVEVRRVDEKDSTTNFITPSRCVIFDCQRDGKDTWTVSRREELFLLFGSKRRSSHLCPTFLDSQRKMMRAAKSRKRPQVNKKNISQRRDLKIGDFF